ncbi:TetR/AcrR family transcriptional regulator [Psychromonas sp. Urea-02u-13]|uniref:TetR/AcrR family transcriptional regulator n=1 Tax=Psychromonas sp. Urea-02u-13 TaxID=2058326 RepID=UPI000C33357C|nr:TetR/AcrR family transcriptional regulator [Psychromonas sp. Urea-02u-13]PKG37340.1 TetR/AcrR family transcriptional regulator [Psychromonas sp. Urea-02u-13]
MAWQTDHKTLTRQRILRSAAKLFSLHGYELVGINEVMADAELTRGAFYSHFKSKSDLYAEAVMNSASEITTFFSNTPTDAFVKSYLSTNHKEGEFVRCPLAFMVTDITQRDTQVRDAYTKVFKGFVNRLVENKDHEHPLELAEALQKAVILIGGVAISRAINDDDLAGQLLKACQSGLLGD